MVQASGVPVLGVPPPYPRHGRSGAASQKTCRSRLVTRSGNARRSASLPSEPGRVATLVRKPVAKGPGIAMGPWDKERKKLKDNFPSPAMVLVETAKELARCNAVPGQGGEQ